MPDYERKALDMLQHPKPKIPQYASHLWSVPAHGKRFQMAPDIDESDILGKKGHQENTVYYDDHALLRTISRSSDATGTGHRGKSKNFTRLCSNIPECNPLL